MNFTTPGYEDLELSTQILIGEALRQGIDVDVLDREDNFISLSNGFKKEYVKQATRTSADDYIAPLIMENKQVTKNVLTDHGIHVPEGNQYNNLQDSQSAFSSYKTKGIVVKPNHTNFGLGITIIRNLQSEKEYLKALLFAFNYDSSILVETYIPGQEYRFLIIGNEVAAVLHRIPANVEGDGIHSIKELVEIKNRNPLRGTGYRKPLEKLKLGEEEIAFLSDQGITPEQIPLQRDQVFLRRNSNISTGGDSIDYTDSMPVIYKEIAVKAARAVGAKICGADIIIGDLSHRPGPDSNGDYNYGTIELNFNPALHIHEFPSTGKRHNSEKKVLSLQGY